MRMTITIRDALGLPLTYGVSGQAAWVEHHVRRVSPTVILSQEWPEPSDSIAAMGAFRALTELERLGNGEADPWADSPRGLKPTLLDCAVLPPSRPEGGAGA